MRRIAVLAGTWVLVVAGLPGAARAETAADILAQMGKAYAKIEKMSCKSTVSTTLPGMGVMKWPMEMKVQRPNKLRVEVGGMGAATTVCDGEHIYLYIAAMNAYQKTKAPESVDLQRTGGGPMGGLSSGDLLGTLLQPDNTEALARIAGSASLLAEESVGGLPCHRMRIEASTGVSADIWVDKKDLLLRKMQVDMAEVMKAASQIVGAEAVGMFRNLAPGQMMMVQEYTGYDLAPSFGPETFRFTPPAGAREVDFEREMQSLMGGGAAPGAGQMPDND